MACCNRRESRPALTYQPTMMQDSAAGKRTATQAEELCRESPGGETLRRDKMRPLISVLRVQSQRSFGGCSPENAFCSLLHLAGAGCTRGLCGVSGRAMAI